MFGTVRLEKPGRMRLSLFRGGVSDKGLAALRAQTLGGGSMAASSSEARPNLHGVLVKQASIGGVLCIGSDKRRQTSCGGGCRST
jgi:hypothetical protein